MTKAPLLVPGSRKGWAYGSVEMLDHAAYDGLTDAFDHDSMGASTERFNARYGLTREEQDEIAAASHVRAGKAQADGVFDDEIVPVEVPQRKGDPIIVAADEGVRPDSTAEVLGAAAPGVQLPTARSPRATRRRSPTAPRPWSSPAASGPNPADSPGSRSSARPARSPAPTTRCTRSPPTRSPRPSRRRAARPSDLDLVEINEAFAAVSLQSMRDLGLDVRRRQRARRRHRGRAPDRGIRRAPRAARGARALAPRRRSRRGRALRRRRPGRGAAALALTPAPSSANAPPTEPAPSPTDGAGSGDAIAAAHVAA